MEPESRWRADRQYPLIGPEDPPPFSHYNADGVAQALVVCDHASPAIPAELDQLGLADWVLEKHVAYDIGAADVARNLADALNAPAILSGYSRLIIDPNRRLADLSSFIQVSDGVAIPGNIDLTEEDRVARIRSFFDPYHNAISARLDAFRAESKTPALISIHSCTPVFNDHVRPWHIGVLWDKDPRIAKPMLEALGKLQDVCAGDNEPYSGSHPHDFTIDHHAEAAGLPNIGMEFRQDLVDTAEGAAHWAGAIARVLRPILADPELYQPLS